MSRAARQWAGGVLWMTASSAVVGVLGLVAVTAAARGLGTAQYADFAVTWALFFGVGGVFAGLQAETTRTLGSEDTVSTDGPRLGEGAVALAVPVAVLGGCLAAFAAGANGRAVVGVPILAGLLMLAALTLASGVLAAGLRWSHLAALLCLDASIRTIAVVMASRSGASGWLPVAIASGSVAWLLLVPSTARALRVAAARRRTGFVRRAALAMAAAGCTSAVVGGLPALLALVRSGSVGEGVAAALAGLLLIRSGLLLGVYGLRPVILRYLMSAPVTRSVVGRAVGCCLVAGACYAGLVAYAGPPSLRLVLGADFALDPADACWLAVGAGGLLLMVVLGIILLVVHEHAAAVAGWMVALVASVVLLAAAPTSSSAVLLAASIPPWIGAAVHLRVALRATRSTIAAVPSA